MSVIQFSLPIRSASVSLQDAETPSQTSVQGPVFGQKDVFRLRRPLQATSSSQKSQAARGPKVKSYPRRSHQKSRTGCGNCKKRRVKCDEAQPQCLKCEVFGLLCDYSVAEQPQPHQLQNDTEAELNDQALHEILPLKTDLDQSAFSLSLSTIATLIDEALHIEDISSPQALFSKLCLPDTALESIKRTNTALLNAFVTTFTQYVACASIRDVMRSSMIQVAFGSSYLMHAILAVASLHVKRLLRRNRSNYGSINTYQKIKLLESYHWQRAINLFQSALQGDIGPHNMDALLSTCILTSTESLCPEDFAPEQSWVFSSDPSQLNWLCLQGGLRCLIQITTPYLSRSIWATPFMESREVIRHFSDLSPGRLGLHEGLADICAIKDDTTSETNPYHNELRILSPMLKMSLSSGSSFSTSPSSIGDDGEDALSKYNKFVIFMGRLSHEFIALLRKKDPAALTIFAYWMALMCPLADVQPWIKVKIIPECVAVCMFLETSAAQQDHRIMRLLEFPAKACGYWSPRS